MKKRIIILSLLMSLFTALFPMATFAQDNDNQNAIYIFRNDGDFNAFLNIDVDSITYSKVDLNGQVHPVVVVQEVWTSDSVYRIPIDAIDSIAFSAPAPIFKDEVFHITESHIPYVTSATDDLVTFDTSIPASMLPGVGQVVISDYYLEPFDKGFAGRVVRLYELGGVIRMECSSVTLEDVYEQLICVGKTVTYNEAAQPAGAPKRIHVDEQGVLAAPLGDLSLEILKGQNGNVTLSVTPEISLDYAICYNIQGQENRLKFVVQNTLDCTLDMNYSFTGELNLEEYPTVVQIPTSVPGLITKIGFGGYIDVNGSVQLNTSIPFTLQSQFGYDSQKTSNGGLVFNCEGTKFDPPESGTVSLNAEISSGLAMQFGACILTDFIAGADLTLKAGPKVSGEFDFNLANMASTYEMMKDSHFTFEPLNVTISGGVNLFGSEKDWSWTLPSIFPVREIYLFPSFTAPYLPRWTASGYSPTALTTDITRDVLFPVTPGIRLYKNGIQQNQTFSAKQYQYQASWKGSDLQMELKNCPVGTYTATPIFKLFGNTIVACPSSDDVKIPEPVSLNKTDVYVKNGGNQHIQISGGWGAYSLINSNPNFISANFVSNDGSFANSNLTMWPPTSISGYENEIPMINIHGNSCGSTVLQLKDLRSGRIVSVNVTVNNTGNTPAISVNPTSLDFGTIAKGGSASKTFTVTGTDLTDSLTISSDNSHFTVNPSRIAKYEAVNGVDVTVTYKSTVAGTHGGYITVSGGGAEAKNVSVLGNCVVPAISVTPSSLDFGNVVVGSTPVKKTFTVNGTDLTGDLTLTLSQTDAHGDFSISQTTITAAQAASGATVTVTCSATEAGSFSGQITISGGGATTKKVTLSGTAVVPTNPTITPSTTSLAFGNVVVGAASVKKTFTVTGTDLTGDLTLTLSQTGAHGEFSISPTTISKSAAANGVTVTVTCSATEAGSFSGQITISGGGATSKKVSLSGNAVVPTITCSPTSLAFGNVVKGNSSSKTFTVTGTNLTGDLTLSSNSDYYTVSPTTISKSSAANGVTVTVTYNPTVAGSNTGKITVSGGGATSKSVSLTGTCVVPTITVNPSSLNFDTVIKGKTSSKTFVVTGTNLTGDLTLSSNYTRFTVSPTTISKSDAANGVTVTVTYKPTAAANHKGQITVSGGGAESKTVTLKGTCIAPTITVTPTSLDFGNVVKGKSASNTFTVTGTDLTGNLSLSSNNDYYTVSPSTISPSDAANGVTVTVTYKPTAVGSHTGKITVSGGDAASKTVSLSGAGVIPTITPSTTSLDFGNVVVGAAPVKKTFTVTGTDLTGDLSLTLSQTGAHGEFSISPTTISKSAAANGVTVTVTCSATDEGSFSGQITISGGGATSKKVTLSGTAVVPKITPSTTSLAFGNVVINETATKTFTVTGSNLTGNLTLSSNNTAYTVSPTTITASQAAAGTTVTVTFKPTSSGSKTGTITISGGGATSKTVSLTGTGALRSITTNPSSLSFTDVTVGKSESKTFTVTGSNLNGPLTLTLNNTSGMFSIDRTSITADQATAGAVVTVTYKPTSSTELGNSHGASITISGGGATSKTVTVVGTAVNRTISPSVTSLDFGNVAVGESKSLTFKVNGTNLTGPVNLTLSQSGAHGYFTISPSSQVSSGGTVTVTYTATEAGSCSGQITISGGGAIGSKTVSLSATSYVPNPTINVNPSSLVFSSGQTSKTFRVTGTDLTGDLSLLLVDTTGVFSINKTTITKSQAASGVDVTVTLSPLNPGVNTVNAKVKITGGGATAKMVTLQANY